ncbi:MAG: hypothetical protein ABMA01_09415 [Chthoniobacteraceae bacterium]
MPEPSQIPVPKPKARLQKCVDCGNEFETTSGFESTVGCCDACQRRRLDLIDRAVATGAPPPVTADVAKPFRYWILWTVLGLVGALASAGFIMAPKARRYLDRRKAGQLVERSRDYFEKRDYKHAIIDSRSALDLQPFNVEANRIIAKSLESLGSPDAILWRKRLVSVKADDAENNLALAKSAFDAGDDAVAQEAILKLKPTHQDSLLYHEIAAGLAVRKQDAAAAEVHWAAASRLDPKNEDFKFKRSILQIKSADPAVRAEAVKALDELATTDTNRIQAIRALIEDAMSRQRAVRARELVDALVVCPQATFLDKVWRLSVLRALRDPRASKYLLELKEASLSKPEELSQLMNWMNQSNLALMVSEWAAELPKELLAKPPIATSVADAYVQGTDWEKLKALTQTASWGVMDFLRHAYVSRALQRLGDQTGSASEWTKSLAAAEDQANRLQMLVKLVQGWRWEEGADQALRKLSADETSPVWVIDSLWDVSLKAGDSTELHRLAKLLVKADPTSVSARDKLNRLSLLRHSEEGLPEVRAQELYKAHPTNISVATTYALSLYLRARIFDALAVMRPFKPDQLRDPGVALYYGMLLARAARTNESLEYLQIGESVPLLREEQDLLEKVKRECRLRPSSPDAPKENPATGKPR